MSKKTAVSNLRCTCRLHSKLMFINKYVGIFYNTIDKTYNVDVYQGKSYGNIETSSWSLNSCACLSENLMCDVVNPSKDSFLGFVLHKFLSFSCKINKNQVKN